MGRTAISRQAAALLVAGGMDLSMVRRRRKPAADPILGGGLGLACMVKPPVVGGFFLGVLSLHYVATHRQIPWSKRWLGPLLGVVVCFAVAAPWHLHQWCHWGDSFLYHYFQRRIVERVI